MKTQVKEAHNLLFTIRYHYYSVEQLNEKKRDIILFLYEIILTMVSSLSFTAHHLLF